MVVCGLWAKGTMGMCKLTIKKLKATNEKGVSLALGELTGHQKDQMDSTIHIRVGGSVRLVVGGLAAEI